MPKPWEKYQAQAVSAPTGPWERYQQEDTGPSYLESAARGGAQGLTLGFADEAMGATQAVRDYILGRRSTMSTGIGDDYVANRDMERSKFQAAREANPKTYGAAQLGGAIAPAAIATIGTKGAALPAVMGRLGAMGAIEGLGHSEADLTKGEFGRAAIDTGVGGAVGAAIPPAMKGIGMAGRGAMSGIRGALGEATELGGMGAKQLASATFDVPVAAIETKLAKPGAVRTAKTFAGLAESMPEDVAKIQARIDKFDEMAKATLNPNKPALGVNQVAEHIEKLAAGQGPGRVQRTAARNLRQFSKDIQSIYKDKPALNELELKQLIKDADANINWSDPGAKLQNNLFKNVRHYFDESLKVGNPAYEEAMKPVAVHMRMKDDLVKQFGLKKIPGQGLVATDVTATKLKQLPKEGKIQSSRVAQQMKDVMGRDYAEKARLSEAREAFDTGRLRLPPFGRIAGEGSGGKSAERIIDAFKNYQKGNIGELLQTEPQAFGKWAPLLEQAATRGTNSLITTHYVLQQQDPEYRIQLDNIQKELQGQTGR